MFQWKIAAEITNIKKEGKNIKLEETHEGERGGPLWLMDNKRESAKSELII